MERLYAAVAELAVFAGALPLELAAMALGRSDRERLGARLGRAPRLVSPIGRRIVVHAVSTGETAAAGALARRWAGRFPADRLLLTAGNAEGLAAAGRLAREIPAIDAVVPLPWDRPRALRRFLAALDPALVVVVETELWPGLFRATEELGIPLALASARVYPKDVARYRLALPLFRRALAIPAWIGAQSGRERERLIAIGAPPGRVEVAGDLKLGAVAPASPVALPRRPPSELWCAGVSTHDGEEERLLDAFAAVRAGRPGLRLVLAPRHVRRAAGIARRALRRGLAVARLGDGTAAPFDVLVVDRMGALAPLLEECEIAVLGGSFSPRRGGQSPIEAARAGAAIVAGPHVAHQAERIGSWLRRGALVALDDPDRLTAELRRLVADSAARRVLGERAAAAAREEDPVELYLERLSALAAPGGASAAVGAGPRQAISQRLA